MGKAGARSGVCGNYLLAAFMFLMKEVVRSSTKREDRGEGDGGWKRQGKK